MPRLIDYFSGRFDWRYRPGRSIVEDSSESEQETSRDSSVAKSNQRETSDQNKSDYKRVTEKYNCVTEPFKETLRLIDELF